MAPPWQQLLADLGDQLDGSVLPRLYDAASLEPSEIRADLDRRGIRRLDPTQPDLAPSRAQLDESADRLVRSARRGATLRGAVAGMGGLLTVPPEAAVALVQLLHLAQRLAVLYGHDPHSDAGRLVLLQGLAEALDIQLPRQARVGLKLSDLPAIAQKQLPEATQSGAWLVRTLAARTAVTAASRVARVVPGLGAGLTAFQARRAMGLRGRRLTEFFDRRWGGTPFEDGPVEDAVELPLDPAHPSR